VTLDVEAGRVSEELARRGIAAGTQVRVLAEVVEGDERLLMAALLRPAVLSPSSLKSPTSTPMPTRSSGTAECSSSAPLSSPGSSFIDLSEDKRRPALVVSYDNGRREDVVVCFITSVHRSGPDAVPIEATSGTGLKIPSVVRFDKVASLDKSVITGKLGDAPPAWLTVHRATFFEVFGFGVPPASS
jgi:mRNA interferase MazF